MKSEPTRPEGLSGRTSPPATAPAIIAAVGRSRVLDDGFERAVMALGDLAAKDGRQFFKLPDRQM